MRSTGQAIVLVGCTDPDAVPRRDDVEMLGENAWGPFPLAEAHKIAEDINQVWMGVLAEHAGDRDHGIGCFPYGPPHATVHEIFGARNRSPERADIVREAAENWYRS